MSLIIKGYNTFVNYLKDDAFNVLISLHKYMQTKIHDKDLTYRYYNFKGTNLDYWGDGYKLIEKLVQLPKSKRDEIKYMIFKESENQIDFLYYYRENYYKIELKRENKDVHKIMDRLLEIFKVEDERRTLVKKWKYLAYVMS